MTSDHLLSALSIATPFNLHLQAIRICGRCIITDHRLVSVGLLPQGGGGAELGMCAPDFSFLSDCFTAKLTPHFVRFKSAQLGLP